MPRRAPTLDIDAVVTEVLAAKDSDDTDAMLDVTSELLAAYGIKRWTMDDVAERAGLARATVYRRFESREKLVRAALIRDARRFFAAVASAVEGLGGIQEKVVEGFVVGLELIELSPVPRLLESDPAAAVALVTSGTILRAGRRALVESYEAQIGARVPPADRPRVEAVAEALVRLGLSVLVTPGLLTGTGRGQPGRAGTATGGRPARPPARNRDQMRTALTAVIGPLLSRTG